LDFIWHLSIFVTAFIAVGGILSLLLSVGFQRPWVSLFLWYIWACLFNANNFISNPTLPYIGWTLFSLFLIPTGEPWSYKAKIKVSNWKLPYEFYFGAWVILAMGYSISGYAKLISPSWQDGTAIFHLVNNPLARDTALRDLILNSPLFLLKAVTYFALFFEVAFLFFCFTRLGRLIAWFSMVAMHFSILCLVDFADLTFGMLMIHLFTFDSKWLDFFESKDASQPESKVIYFDGICGLCNGFVDFIISEDQTKVFQFSPLQSDMAKRVLPPEALKVNEDSEFTSICLKQGSKIYYRSDAIIQILQQLGGVWILLKLLRILPTSIRDGLYSFIARNRYRLFGKKDTCRIPTPEERSRFIL
jgi:predicted DCC family thiol-disulfide oxidoreductase YuxK